MNPSLILDIPMHDLYYPPPRVWLDLLSTFVLPDIYLWFSSEEDPDFVVEDVK
jgi:hypothetical protein